MKLLIRNRCKREGADYYKITLRRLIQVVAMLGQLLHITIVFIIQAIAQQTNFYFAQFDVAYP